MYLTQVRSGMPKEREIHTYCFMFYCIEEDFSETMPFSTIGSIHSLHSDLSIQQIDNVTIHNQKYNNNNIVMHQSKYTLLTHQLGMGQGQCQLMLSFGSICLEIIFNEFFVVCIANNQQKSTLMNIFVFWIPSLIALSLYNRC